jgi:hypothetical protein
MTFLIGHVSWVLANITNEFSHWFWNATEFQMQKFWEIIFQLSMPTGRTWNKWGVLSTGYCHACWRWLSDFLSDTQKVMRYDCTESLHFNFWFCWNSLNCYLESVIFEFSLLSHTYVFKLALHIYISWQKLIGMSELQVETCLLRLCTKIYLVLLFCYKAMNLHSHPKIFGLYAGKIGKWAGVCVVLHGMVIKMVTSD